MNKIFWICFQCFKKEEEKPEDIKSKEEIKDESTSIKVPEITLAPGNLDASFQADALLQPDKKEFKRKKYVRIRSKTSQCQELDLSLSDMDVSNSSIVNENNQNPNPKIP